MDSSQDFKSLQDKIQASLLSTTRTVNQIANEDLTFQRTANPSTGDRLEEQSTRLLGLASQILKSAATSNGSKSVGALEDTEDVEIHWTGIVDVVDGLLEKADTCLDEYTGRVKRKSDFPEPAQSSKKPKTSDRAEPNWRRANIIKPQNAFEKKVDNFATGPWKPLLTNKPHATVPLEDSLGVSNDENNQQQYDYATALSLLTLNWSGRLWDDFSPRERKRFEGRISKLQQKGSITDTNGQFRFKHPYETEILNLKYPSSTYESRDPIPYQPIDKAPAIWIDTYEGVLEMLEELKQAKEIAVDLEHHDMRTYQGLLSLMQISTREKDWVIDTLQPWRHKLEVLNEVFADPKILKVFHGAFMDIIWLQRDLGLYIVGLFDTYHACVALDYPQKSLAYLLKRHVDFDADKKYQMADWRIRPLTDEMLYYARCDTHYLLYVYDIIRNELVNGSDSSDPQKNLIEFALQRSKETSLDRYTPYLPDPSTGEGGRGWANTLLKSSVRLDGPQFAVYRAVHKWRDDLAREEDENPVFIMPPQTLMEIAKLLPGDPKALWSILGGRCAAKVQRSVEELFKIISEARKEGADGPSSVEHFRRGHLEDASVAAIARRELGKSTKAELDLPPVEELRSQQSQLFGPVSVSSLWEGNKKVLDDASNKLISLPWTSFVQEAAASSAEQEAQAKAKAQQEAADMILLETKPQPAPPVENVEMDNTEFTLRQGRKRKLEDVQDEEESGSEDEGVVGVESQDVISLEVGKETKAERRARRKMLKKAEKEATREQSKARQKRLQEAKDKEGGEEVDEPDFDYSQAQSILHGQRSVANNHLETNRAKAFDPYAARMNAEGAPKPARRMHSERPGKTATFKK